jgi:hypothetical protein
MEPKASENLIDSLEKQIHSFPNNVTSAAALKYGELDVVGTELWNICTRLKRREEYNKQQAPVVIVMTRVYAFLMLDCAQSSGNGTLSNILRVKKIALKTAKNCLGMPYPPIVIFIHAL